MIAIEESLCRWLSVVEVSSGVNDAKCATMVVASHGDTAAAKAQADQLKAKIATIGAQYKKANVTKSVLLNALEVKDVIVELWPEVTKQGRKLMGEVQVPRLLQDLLSESFPKWMAKNPGMKYCSREEFATILRSAAEFGIQNEALVGLMLQGLCNTGRIIAVDNNMLVIDKEWLSVAMSAIVRPSEGVFKGVETDNGWVLLSFASLSSKEMKFCNLLINFFFSNCRYEEHEETD